MQKNYFCQACNSQTTKVCFINGAEGWPGFRRFSGAQEGGSSFFLLVVPICHAPSKDMYYGTKMDVYKTWKKPTGYSGFNRGFNQSRQEIKFKGLENEI